MKYRLEASISLVTVYNDDDEVVFIVKRKSKWLGVWDTRIYQNDLLLLESTCRQIAFWDSLKIIFQALPQILIIQKTRSGISLKYDENILSKKHRIFGNPQYLLLKNGNVIGEVHGELFKLNSNDYIFEVIFFENDTQQNINSLIFYIISTPRLTIN